MSNKTINQALKDLYTGLGGDPQALADNSTCSDYIEDLESAIKGAASGAQIDDETASETTVFSSSKTEDLIKAIPSLPSVAVGDIGEALIVESDGEGGAQWGKGAIPTPEQNTVVFSASGTLNSVTLDNATYGDIKAAIGAKKNVVINNVSLNRWYRYSDYAGEGIDTNQKCQTFSTIYAEGNPAVVYAEFLVFNQGQADTGRTLTRITKTLALAT